MLLTDDPLLVSTAQKNYDVFKVPTNFVEASKTVRYYTKEQQADLDVKTSVNLIGDIINLSQELQTKLWHRYNNGATYDDIKELYYDICQLDIMSNIEIDSAKKEFSISNKEELKKLKSKWTTSMDGKIVKPYFFKHIAKAKGYLNEETKLYFKHDSSMDYVAQVMDRFRSKQKENGFLPILDVFKFDGYDVKLAKTDQVEKITNDIIEFKDASFYLWNLLNDNTINKFEIYESMKATLVRNINKEKISVHTMYYLLKKFLLSNDDKFKSYGMMILFSIKNKSVFNFINKNKKDIQFIKENTDGDIDIYGIKHSKITKKC